MPTKLTSDDTIRTSPSIRRKGKVVGRIVVNCLKLFRACKKHEKAQPDIKNTEPQHKKNKK